MIPDAITVTSALAAAQGPSFLSQLGSLASSAGSIGNLFSGVKNLFGGDDDDGPNQEELLQMQLGKQYEWTAHSARSLPAEQVKGLRAAGLNPMLAVGKGISAPDYAHASLSSDDRAIGVQRQQNAINAASAMGQLSLQNAQIRLTEAQTAKTMAEAETEKMRPANVDMSTQHLRAIASNQYALETLAKNQGLQVAAQTIQQELINQINSTGWLAETKKFELKKLINEFLISDSDAQRAKADQRFYESKIGEMARSVRLILNALGIGGR